MPAKSKVPLNEKQAYIEELNQVTQEQGRKCTEALRRLRIEYQNWSKSEQL